MDKIKITQVEQVACWKQGKRVVGDLHLTAHHIIFHYPSKVRKENPTAPEQPAAAAPRHGEFWIAYPLLAFCTFRPSHPQSRQQPSIRLRCRDFSFVAFQFAPGEEGNRAAGDVYDSIRSLTCKLGKVEKLYAFKYLPSGPEKQVDGWRIYDAKREWKRQGISEKDSDKGWRISSINVDYQYSPTYPAVLVVPTTISDNTLNYAGSYRSRVRVPVLTYLHSVNNCSITRSSQPLVGVGNKRSVQDERLVAAIFSTSRPHDQALEASAASSSSLSGTNTPSPEASDLSKNTEESLEAGERIGSLSNSITVKEAEDMVKVKSKHIYGAQQSNMIIDARPTINAYAMQAIGMGSENMDNYPWATKEYLGIANIHVMRDSLNKVVDALKDYDLTNLPPNREQLAKSGWLKHIALLLKGSKLIAERVGLGHSHVLIHCSDGWDRTSQLSALSQLCLDPFYRTIEGFIILIEKDWLSFGHMFRYRSGFLSSEKWFEVENERIGGNRSSSANSSPSNAGGATNAFQDAMKQAKGFFNRKNDSRESLAESDGENPYEVPPPGKRSSQEPSDHIKTKVKETSPVFHQFLDATYQLVHQHPNRFEFNERFLRRLLYHLYSCQYGTFLYDNEKARHDANLAERTRSVWDYFLARKQEFINPQYDADIDDHVPGKERLLFPDETKIRWWASAFGRTDKDLNGLENEAGLAISNDIEPVVTGVEGPHGVVGLVEAPEAMPKARLEGLSTDEKTEGNNSNTLVAGLASLGLGLGKSAEDSTGRSRQHSPAREVEMVGVEMK